MQLAGFGVYTISAFVLFAALAFEFRKEIAAFLRRETPAKECAPHAHKFVGPPLEIQISALNRAGLRLNPGVSIEDLLNSFSRDQFEADPYALLLFMYGAEIEAVPSGRTFCDYAHNLDSEAIDVPGSYAAIVKDLAALTGRADLLTAVGDTIDHNKRLASVSYQFGATSRSMDATYADDWADPVVIRQILIDIETTLADGREFWGAINGQSTTVFLIEHDVAQAVNQIHNGIVQRLVSQP